MAPNIFTRKTADGNTTTYTRKGTQGRKKIPPELLKVKLSARIARQTRSRINERAALHNMTVSSYCDLALALFDIGNYVGQLPLGASWRKE